jgi:hypothetical protein
MLKFFFQITTLTIMVSLFVSCTHLVYANTEVYQLNLFYDIKSRELRLDRFVEDPINKVVLSDGLSYNELLNKTTNNTIEVTLVSFDSDFPQPLHYPVQTGEFQLNIPYFPHVKEIRIKHPDANSQLIVSVEKTAICNQNSVCESDRGETQDNCIADCAVEGRSLSELEQNVQERGSDTDTKTTQERQSQNLTWRIVVGISLFVVAGGLIVRKVISRIRS